MEEYVCAWDPARLGQALRRPILREPTLSDILPELTNAYYMTVIDASSGYNKLKCG